MQAVNTKQLAAEQAVTYIQSGMTVGLGTGSTAVFAIQKIGMRVAEENLHIRTIATSERSETLARELNIPVVSFEDIEAIDITIDGADEVDKDLNLIKGGGGALLREKIVSAQTKTNIIIVDETKLVNHLGAFPLPVEVVPFALAVVNRQLQHLGCITTLRQANNKTYITDNHNYILDCHFEKIPNPAQLHEQINAIVGVVDNGLFVNRANIVIAAYNDGAVITLTNRTIE